MHINKKTSGVNRFGRLHIKMKILSQLIYRLNEHNPFKIPLPCVCVRAHTENDKLIPKIHRETQGTQNSIKTVLKKQMTHTFKTACKVTTVINIVWYWN